MDHNPLVLIIDVQVGFFSNPRGSIFAPEALLEQIKTLLKKARAAKIPILFVQHDGRKGSFLETGTSGWNLHPSIAPNSEKIIRKKTPSAFVGTDLDAELKRMSINTLIIAGIQSDLCVDSTVRHATFLGYKVILVKDAHSTFDSASLKAPQIIAHHNEVLGENFAKLKHVSEINFPLTA